jgi:hypothetical protein
MVCDAFSLHDLDGVYLRSIAVSWIVLNVEGWIFGGGALDYGLLEV